MPTVLRIDGFRFFFFSDEHTPLHIHVEKGDGYMRIEIQTLKITNICNFSSKDIKNITKIVKENQLMLTKAWNEYFN